MWSVSRSVDAQLGISFLDCEGSLDGADFQRRVGTGSEESAPPLDVVVDLSGVRSLNFKPKHIEEIARVPMDSSRLAIVAPRPALFGFARMFQIHAEVAGRRRAIGIFKTRDEAIQWLRAVRTAAAGVSGGR